MRFIAICSTVVLCFISSGLSVFFSSTLSCPTGYKAGGFCILGKCDFFNLDYECKNGRCCKKEATTLTSACPSGYLTGPSCTSGTCSTAGFDCMKDINKCCKKLPTITPCLGSVADGSCKTSSDCKSGYKCKLGSCCKDIIISIPTTCPFSMSAGTCDSDTDCKTGYKCESGTCCRSLSTLPRCPVGTVSSGFCTGGRKCGGECVDTLCCENITDIEIGGGSSPKFMVCPPQNRPYLCPPVGDPRCTSDDDCDDPKRPGEKCCVLGCGPAACLQAIESPGRFPGI